MALAASSAVSFPIICASLRLVVIWADSRSNRCTYAGARVPPWFTLTLNFVLVMISPLRAGEKKYERQPVLTFLHAIVDIRRATTCLCEAHKKHRAKAFRRMACKEPQTAQAAQSKADM